MKDEPAGRAPDEQLATQHTGATALFRQATDVAHVCKDIVLKCVIVIAERRYVRVEGWMAISVAHGCIASIKSVENVPGEGVKAVAEIRRISDQAILATAEGFVGVDEPDWYGGEVTRLDKKKRPPVERTLIVKKRPDHAIRAMAQTRAISRVLRAGFSHVVVLIDQKLATIPADEIADLDRQDDDDRDEGDRPLRPDSVGRGTSASKQSGTEEKEKEKEPEKTPPASTGSPTVPRDESIALRDQFRDNKWETVEIHFGNASKGKKLGELTAASLKWWINDWQPREVGNRPIPKEDHLLRAALDVAGEETGAKK